MECERCERCEKVLGGVWIVGVVRGVTIGRVVWVIRAIRV